MAASKLPNTFWAAGFSHLNRLMSGRVVVRNITYFNRLSSELNVHLQLIQAAFEMRRDAAPELIVFEQAMIDNQDFEAFYGELLILFNGDGLQDYMPKVLTNAVFIAAKLEYYCKEASLSGSVNVVGGFFSGWKCKLTGLVNGTQHNEKTCVIQNYNEVKGRWTVLLLSGEIFDVKQQNLTQICEMS